MTDYRDEPGWYKLDADPAYLNKCGSCERYSAPGKLTGFCGLKLPPWVHIDRGQRVMAINSCSFYVSVEEKDRV